MYGETRGRARHESHVPFDRSGLEIKGVQARELLIRGIADR
jgi:hypothetical protein